MTEPAAIGSTRRTLCSVRTTQTAGLTLHYLLLCGHVGSGIRGLLGLVDREIISICTACR